MRISISPGNSKMGMVPSVSLPSYKTCVPNAPCFKLCYAAKIERLRKTVRDAYERNYAIWQADPMEYFDQIDDAIKTSKFFRFHVSGDIVDDEYFARMVDVAERNPHCEMLCFTKKYNIVNQYIDDGLEIPSNLHIIFSVWENLRCDNPHNFPEAHVKLKNGARTYRKDAMFCKGNCENCAKTGDACWTLRPGEQVVFNQH